MHRNCNKQVSDGCRFIESFKLKDIAMFCQYQADYGKS